MHVTVMCGGKGTRLGQPIKCLTPVGGRPFMDWKIAQLTAQKFTQITLAVGPYFNAYWDRYGTLVGYITDNQEGVLPIAQSIPQPSWWCNGDTLLTLHNQYVPNFGNAAEGGEPINHSVAVCTNYIIEPPNVPGGWLDAGLYYGLPPYEWRINPYRPYHINTPEDLAITEHWVTKIGWKLKPHLPSVRN